jgi:hypothetical protein
MTALGLGVRFGAEHYLTTRLEWNKFFQSEALYVGRESSEQKGLQQVKLPRPVSFLSTLPLLLEG